MSSSTNETANSALTETNLAAGGRRTGRSSHSSLNHASTGEKENTNVAGRGSRGGRGGRGRGRGVGRGSRGGRVFTDIPPSVLASTTVGFNDNNNAEQNANAIVEPGDSALEKRLEQQVEELQRTIH